MAEGTKFIEVILEKNHQLALFMICLETFTDELLTTNNLFLEHILLLFLDNMILLHTMINPNMNIYNLVCFAYPNDLTK